MSVQNMHAYRSFGLKSLPISCFPPCCLTSPVLGGKVQGKQKHRKVLKQHGKTRRKKGWRFLLFPGLAGSQEGPGSFGWDIPRPSEDDPGGSPIRISQVAYIFEILLKSDVISFLI